MQFQRFYKFQFGICAVLFFLIVLGAGVRIAHAGLSCPDWPLCFGQLVPTFNTQVFLEWFHRLIAGSVGLAALGSSIYIWTKKQMPSAAKWLTGFSILIFCLQAWLGGQTVIQLLRTHIVTAHLVGGYSLLFVNLLILFRLRRPEYISGPSPLKSLMRLLLIIVLGQAILGALVSSSYAGLACGSEFPTCNGALIPNLSGIIGIHFVHRWNAFAVLALLIISVGFVRMLVAPEVVRWSVKWAFIFVILQITLGVAMLFSEIHPSFSVLHSLFSLSIFTVLARGLDHVYYR